MLACLCKFLAQRPYSQGVHIGGEGSRMITEWNIPEKPMEMETKVNRVHPQIQSLFPAQRNHTLFSFQNSFTRKYSCLPFFWWFKSGLHNLVATNENSTIKILMKAKPRPPPPPTKTVFKYSQVHPRIWKLPSPKEERRGWKWGWCLCFMFNCSQLDAVSPSELKQYAGRWSWPGNTRKVLKK